MVTLLIDANMTLNFSLSTNFTLSLYISNITANASEALDSTVGAIDLESINNLLPMVVGLV
jgi:hypothetical protein